MTGSTEKKEEAERSNENKVLIEQIVVGEYKNFAYIVADLESKEAAVFDPAWDLPKILDIIAKKSLRVQYIINTHSHMDHIEGNPKLKAATGAAIIMSSRSLAKKDIGVQDGQELQLGRNVKLRFIQTPGHSPDSICIIVNDDLALITGDTFFIGECGRVDLPGGSASELYDSFEKIRKLNPNLVVYPGHDYGAKPHTTLAEQLHDNYTLFRREKEDFIRFMSTP